VVEDLLGRGTEILTILSFGTFLIQPRDRQQPIRGEGSCARRLPSGGIRRYGREILRARGSPLSRASLERLGLLRLVLDLGENPSLFLGFADLNLGIALSER